MKKHTFWIPSFFRNFFHSWTLLSANWIIRLVNKLVLIVFLSSLALIALQWKYLPPQVPLFYSRPWGQDQLGNPLWLFLLPLGSMIWYIVNSIFSIYVASEYLIFVQTLFLASLITSLLSFVTLFKILFLVS